MAQIVRDIMTRKPISLLPTQSITEAAKKMREADVGAIVVREAGGKLCGILTDRDIAVRVIAQEVDPSRTTLDEVCSSELATLSPDAALDDAISLMAKKGIRRIPVVENNEAIGILSLGDLALARDPRSALGGISGKPANV